MRIAVNTRLLLPGKLEGLGRFSHETLKRITQQHPEHQFYFIFDRAYSEEFIYSDNITPLVAHPPSRHPVLWYLFFDWGIPRLLKKHKIDLFLSPDGWLSLRTKVPQLPVIHDLNFFHNPNWVDYTSRKYYNFFFPRYVKRSERIATVSEFTKQDIVSRFNVAEDKVDVVFNGCSDGFKPLLDTEKKELKKKYSAGKDFFVFLGLVHPRKNLHRVVKAFSLYKEQTGKSNKLLVIGSLKYMTAEVKEALEASKFKSDVFFTGRMPEEELKHTIASARAMLYPSLFEGFGIPIIEAMHCDVPVLTSNTSSMPEVGGDAALYVDPYSVSNIAEGIIKIDEDEAFRNELLEKAKLQREKFSWDQTARLLWESVEKVIANMNEKKNDRMIE